MIDIFSLKVLALLMCRGSPKEKSQLLMDLVIGKDGLKKGIDSVQINEQRLIKAVSLLIYFSEIFPKQYYQMFQDEIKLSQDYGKVVSTDFS